MAPDYDAQDGVPVTEQLLAELQDAVEDSPWKDILCRLRPSSLNRAYKSHFTMSDSRFASTTQDEKTIDAAQLFVAYDADTVSNWGKLWVSYEVELNTPQTPTLSPNTGNLELQINSLNTNVAGNAPPLSGSVRQTVVQNVNDPILNLSGYGLDGFSIGTFVRDFNGTVTTNLAAPSGAGNYLNSGSQFGQIGTYYPNLVRNGAQIILNSLVGTQGFGDNAGGTSFSNKYRIVSSIAAKAGDILQVPSVGTSSNANSAALNLLIQALGVV
jgi:hypothetical protein